MKRALVLILAAALAGACSAETPPSSKTPAAAPEGPPDGRWRPAALHAHVGGTVPATPEIGWAVMDLGHGGVTGQNPALAYPQQSVFKLWLAAMALDLVDKGQARLDERLLVTRADLGFSWQPIAAKVDADGYPATLEELVRYIVIESDNPSADVLLRRVGGPQALTAWLRGKGVTGISVERDERAMHAAAERHRDLVGAFVNGAAPARPSTPWPGCTAGSCCRRTARGGCCRSWRRRPPGRNGSRPDWSPGGAGLTRQAPAARPRAPTAASTMSAC